MPLSHGTSNYWSLARLADTQAEIAATNKGTTPEDINIRWVEAIELLAVETHLTRKLLEAGITLFEAGVDIFKPASEEPE